MLLITFIKQYSVEFSNYLIHIWLQNIVVFFGLLDLHTHFIFHLVKLLIKSLMGALKLCKFLKWVRRQTFVSFSSSNMQKYKTNVKLYLTVRRQDLLTLSLLVFDFLLQRSMHAFSIMSLTVHLLCYLLQLHLNWWTLRRQGQDNLLYTPI